MKLKPLLTDEDAVSPALGVALLIAITVILVAVVGAVVLGIGPDAGEAPNAQLEFEQDLSAGEVVVTHKGGDSLPASDTIWKVNGTPEGNLSSEMTTGDTLTITSGIGVDAEIRVVWEDPSSDKSQLIGEFTVE